MKRSCPTSPLRPAGLRRLGHPLLTPVALASALLMHGGASLALPTGAEVVAGQATVESSGPRQGLVRQGSSKAVIDWQGFSIGADETLRILQPDSRSVLLNRVVGADPSHLLGQMQANGRVFLVNPNGIVFGEGARIDVGSLVASTLPISTVDFMAGLYRFGEDSLVTAEAGTVLNAGTITAHGGTVALVAPLVINRGLIEAREGRVALAAVDRVRVDIEGDGLVLFEARGDQVSQRLDQLGRIQADGGLIQLRAQARSALADTVLNMDGLLQARSLSQRDGRVIIDGGSQGQVVLSGRVEVQGLEAGTRGGSVQVGGQALAMQGGARIDASGDAGGGTVALGSGWQGAALDTVGRAESVRVESGAEIRADATARGRGGEVVVWSDGISRFQGRISARGGSLQGDGGRVEVSGLRGLGFAGSVDTGATAGQSGLLLLDPDSLVIRAGGMDPYANPLPAGGDLTISPAALEAVVGDVLLTASDTITFEDSLNLGAHNLQVQAGNSIVLEANVSVLAGDLSFESTLLVLNANASLGGNSLTVTGATQFMGGSVTTTGNQTYNGAVALGADTTLSAGAGTVSFGGTVNGARSLAVSAGTVDLNGAVGGSTALTSLGLTAASILLDGGAVTTTGNQTYTGAVTLGADAALRATAAGSDISFSSTVDGSHKLSIDASDGITFGGAVGAATPLVDLSLFFSTLAVGATVNGTGTATLAPSTDDTSIGVAGGAGMLSLSQATLDLFASFGTLQIGRDGGTGVITVGALSLPTNMHLQTEGRIELSATVDGARNLSLDGGPVEINGALGGGVALNSLSVDGSSISLGGGTVNTTGNQTYTGAVTLGADTTLTVTAGTVSFSSTVNGAQALAVSGSTVDFNGAVGGVTALTGLALNAMSISLDGGAVSTTGNQTYSGAVTLGANTTLSSDSGTVSFGSTINGARSLTVSAGTVDLNGIVGGGMALTSLGLTAASILVDGGTITTTGNQTYNGAVTLGADTTLAATAPAGTVRFDSTVDGARSLSVSAGTVDLNGAVGVGTALTGLGLTAASILLDGGAVTTTGNQTYNGAVTLGAGTTLSATAPAGTVSFGGTVNGASSLAVSAGTVDLNGAVGGSTALTSLELTAASILLDGGAVTTTGNQIYTGAVTLGANTILTSTAGTVSFSSTVNGAHSLSVSAGTADLNGAVGGGMALTSLGLTAASISLDGGAISTTGNQTYTGAVTLGADTILAAGAGSVSFSSTVNGAQALAVSGSTVDFNGAVGGVTALTSLGLTAMSISLDGGAISTTGNQTYSGAVTLGANTTLSSDSGTVSFGSTINGARSLSLSAGTVDLNGAVGGGMALTSLALNAMTISLDGSAVTTSGNQTYAGPVALGADTTLAATAPAGTVSFGGTVDGARSLSVSAGTVDLDGAVGVGTALTGLGLNATSILLDGGAISTTGNQSYSGAVALGASTTLTADAGTVSFSSTVDGAHALAVSGGTVDFNAAVGSSTALSSLTLNAAAIALDGGSIRTTDNQTYSGAVALGANTVLSAVAGTVRLDSTVDGNHMLSVSAGTVDLNGAVGVGVALNGLELNAASILLDGGRVTTAGGQSYDGAVTLGADTTLAGGSVGFSRTVDGARALTVSGGSVSFQDLVGSHTPLSSLDLGVTSILLQGGAITSTGHQTHAGAVTLGADTVLSAGTGTLRFGSTVDGAQTLAVSAGTINLQGAVGSGTPLSSLDLSAGAIQLSGGAVTSTGNQTYTGAVTLGANTTLAAGAGTVSFSSTVDGTPSLTVSAGTVDFNGAVGGSTALGMLELSAGSILLDGGMAHTSADQRYLGAVTLGVDTTLTAPGGEILFAAAVDGAHRLSAEAASIDVAQSIGLGAAPLRLRLVAGSLDFTSSTVRAQEVELATTSSDLHLANLQLTGTGASSIDSSGMLSIDGLLDLQGGSLVLTARAAPSASTALLSGPTPLTFGSRPLFENEAVMVQGATGRLLTAAGSHLALRAPALGSIRLDRNDLAGRPVNSFGGTVSAVSGTVGESSTLRFGNPPSGIAPLELGVVRLSGDQIAVAGRFDPLGPPDALRAGIEADVVHLRADRITTNTGDDLALPPVPDGQIRARLPFLAAQTPLTQQPSLNFELLLPAGGLPIGNPYGGPAPEDWIQTIVGDAVGGLVGVQPRIVGDASAFRFVFIGGPVMPVPFYDPTASNVRVFYNGETALTPQEQGALSSVIAVIERARRDRFEEAVRTENAASRLRQGVIAEVGPGRPATEGTEGLRPPPLCDLASTGLRCAP